MSRLDLMTANKKLYNKVLEETEKMPMGLEWAVKYYIILEWIKGVNWMGGISDSKHQKACDKIMSDYGVDYDTVFTEELKQMKEYLND